MESDKRVTNLRHHREEVARQKEIEERTKAEKVCSLHCSIFIHSFDVLGKEGDGGICA